MTVQVGTVANVDPTVVSVSKAGPNTIRFCLLGQPDSTVLVERSDDLQTWTPAGNLTADALGSLLYEDSMTAGKQFYRFRRL